MRSVAILCNPHAQRATPELLSALRSTVPGGDFLLTQTIEDAHGAAQTIVDRGYDAVCVAGGDGTIAQLCTDLFSIVSDDGRLPVIVPLRLGTGCALGDVCEASPPTQRGLVGDVERARQERPTSPLHLLDVGGRLGCFSGVGLDADYADDFRRIVKQGLSRTPFARFIRGVPGLVVTAAALTVPRLVVRPRRAMRLVNIGEPAYRLDTRGKRTGDPFPTGAVMHEGQLTIAAASTIWSYAFKTRFFPFVDELGAAFQLRVSSANGLQVLTSLPRAVKGQYTNPDLLWDYAATGVAIELEEPAPYHIAGDVQPASTRFEIRLAPRTVPIVRPHDVTN